MTKVLALDLEGTLISNAMSQFPRPHLHAFLSRCRELFPRLVIFTAVSEFHFRRIANRLVAEGHAPEWFATLEYVAWSGPTKNLEFVHNVDSINVILVDDHSGYVHPGQESQCVLIEPFDYERTETDVGLKEAIKRLEAALL